MARYIGGLKDAIEDQLVVTYILPFPRWSILLIRQKYSLPSLAPNTSSVISHFQITLVVGRRLLCVSLRPSFPMETSPRAVITKTMTSVSPIANCANNPMRAPLGNVSIAINLAIGPTSAPLDDKSLYWKKIVRSNLPKPRTLR